jgi:hypothetical protein
MGIEVHPSNTRPEGDEHRTPIPWQGVGGALLLVGWGLIYSVSPMGTSSVGAGVGLLLLLVGWGLIIPGQPEDPSTG